ncbi:hypothetical protein HNO91_12045 [Pseudomonas corrugata]|uniref:Uncharacterized protein n=1 Tax=Pseudomonas corrugata TaxID=47879 RepID=A0A7Y5Z7R1_9PSED|nr:hypothetical protein [Pseudomonas corrugata]NUT87158.1 hypothetical protein [Pseudomonas corrugata]
MKFPSAAAALDFLNSPEAKASADQYQARLDALRLKSKDAQVEQALERSRPAPIQPIDGISITLPAETDPSQIAFEAWAVARGLNIEKIHQSNEYQSKSSRELWWCWQASREVHGAMAS